MYFQGNPKYVRIDGAHTYAIDGIGKNYLATAILLLLHMDYFGSGSTESKFETAYKRYMIFCAANGKSTSIHEFSYKTLKLKTGSLRGKPCGLGKGHDAAIVGAWLGEELGQLDLTLVANDCRDILEVLQWSCAAINRFWRCIYSNGIWLSREQAKGLDGYATLAKLSCRYGMVGCHIRPKLHMFCHIVLDIEHMLLLHNEQCPVIESPAVALTWADEDFIGRISRVSRRTHPLSAAWNTLRRCLGLYRRQWAGEFHKSYLL
ncbi:Uncharacterized protein SCF082_LOCUS49027 [Durusdinium trenchii]|uniref:RNase H type-1 domain-containing protein n=1 Tax=Durusdinium trenchii TaxID=1381693 RepID=A0ABP0RXU8_9DINO